MILSIDSILDAAERQSVTADSERLSWRDGRATAGNTAKSVKMNDQADLTSASGKRISSLISDKLSKHPVVTAAARPRRFSPLLLSRMAEQGHYGPHIDNAIMKKGQARFRSDLSFTLFLSDPGSYDGGDLVIHEAGAVQSLKEAAGSLILYPSSSIHEVTPVTRGTRLVCVGWIESMIANGDQRALLFDMENLRVSLRSKPDASAADLLMLDKSIANLLRMWARPL